MIDHYLDSTQHPYHVATILELKRGWMGIKIAKVSNVHFCVLICDNGKRYDSGKDLPYFDFASDRQ